MSRIVYVNGDYVPEAEAKVSIFDRGFLMADGVYEVTSVLGGKLIDFEGHCRRLARSLSELDMAAPSRTRSCWRSIENSWRATRSSTGWSISRSRAARPATATSPFPIRPARRRRW